MDETQRSRNIFSRATNIVNGDTNFKPIPMARGFGYVKKMTFYIPASSLGCCISASVGISAFLTWRCFLEFSGSFWKFMCWSKFGTPNPIKSHQKVNHQPSLHAWSSFDLMVGIAMVSRCSACAILLVVGHACFNSYCCARVWHLNDVGSRSFLKKHLCHSWLQHCVLEKSLCPFSFEKKNLGSLQG